MNDRPALTVGELTAQVKLLVEENFTDVWVVGEISNLTRARSGHVYLTLKDEDASLSSVIWRSTAGRLRHDLAEGMEVLARGRLSVYPPRGAYQLVISLIEPRGVGALQVAFDKLFARLRDEGLFDPAAKRPLPFLPRAIGVVTSPTGAAIRDILKVLRRRFPPIEVVLCPARVQGEGAAEEVAAGIRALEERGGLDVLIVGRGGGSLEDLWAFNEEAVARAIAACDIPVISAVGHEVDVTIADHVADVRAATPSAAAETAVPSLADLVAGLDASRARLDRALMRELQTRREMLRTAAGGYGLRRFPDRLGELAQRLDDLSRRLGAGADGILSDHRRRIEDLASRAEALSPVAVLARGYSVTSGIDENEPIRAAREVVIGDRIRTRLHSGTLVSRVEETDDGEGSKIQEVSDGSDC